jgi:hypothetical protein
MASYSSVTQRMPRSVAKSRACGLNLLGGEDACARCLLINLGTGRSSRYLKTRSRSVPRASGQ